MGGERTAEAEGERLHLLVTGRSLPTKADGAADRETAADSRPSAVAISRALLRRIPQTLASEVARDGGRGAGFLCLPVLMSAGVVAYYALPQEPGFPHIFASILALMIACFLLRAKPAGLLCAGALLAFMAGVGVAKIETWRAGTAVLGSDVTTRITGRVVSIEPQANARIRLIVDIVSTQRPQLRHPPERVRLTARKVPPDLRPGDLLDGLVRLMPPSGPVRPGSYDFSFVSYFAGIGALGFFMTGPERAAIDADASLAVTAARSLETLRLALAERIRTHVDGAAGEVVVAMIAGYRPGIPEDVNEWLRRSGLAHILSISGLHMALVAATVMFMLRATAALFPGFSSRVPVKKYAASAALVFCTLYLFLSGTDVAAQRSYIMLAVMLAALILDRAALTMRNVAIAALIIIVLSPHEVVGPSFQMSFAATAALVAGYAVWSERRGSRPRGRALRDESFVRRTVRMALGLVVGMAATSLIAGTATALYGVWHFQRATPLALPANLAAMPFVSGIAMPAAVLSIFAMPFGLDGIFLKAMAEAMRAVILIAKWFSDRSPIDAVGLIPLSALIVLTVALIIAVISTSRLKLLAVPVCLVGLALLATRDLPDVLISEDGRLVGVRGEDGTLAINRARPNAFTMQDWTRALNAEMVVKPLNQGKPSAQAPETAFTCTDELCLARHASGAVIGYAESELAAAGACSSAAVIVIDDATAGKPCRAGQAEVITKRDLARQGSASVHFRRRGEGLEPEITFAIGEQWRLWHEHRAWSRASRGLPPNNGGTRRSEPE